MRWVRHAASLLESTDCRSELVRDAIVLAKMISLTDTSPTSWLLHGCGQSANRDRLTWQPTSLQIPHDAVTSVRAAEGCGGGGSSKAPSPWLPQAQRRDLESTANRASGGRVEVLWRGALGMDAERASLGHGWPVDASPRHNAGARGPLRIRGRTSAKMVLPTFSEKKVGRPSGRNQNSKAPQIALIPLNSPSHCFPG
jgi:hypothetical protein